MMDARMACSITLCEYIHDAILQCECVELSRSISNLCGLWFAVMDSSGVASQSALRCMRPFGYTNCFTLLVWDSENYNIMTWPWRGISIASFEPVECDFSGSRSELLAL
jgi:hypothetical protein